MTKRGGYQQTAAGAFGAKEALERKPLTAEECAILARWVERSESTESDNREWNLVWDILTREARVSLPRLLATIPALRAEAADARRAALLEAAEACQASGAFNSGAYEGHEYPSDWLRARAATPTPPAADPRDARIAALEELVNAALILCWRCSGLGRIRHVRWLSSMTQATDEEPCPACSALRAALSPTPPAAPQAAGSEEPPRNPDERAAVLCRARALVRERGEGG